MPCPCGTGIEYTACCGAFIEGAEIPPTPEALMRSRYTAYTKANIEYITRTMKSPASDGFDPVSAKQWAASVKWLRLNVIRSSVDGHIGYVEFIAYFKENGKHQLMHELSEFRLEAGRWYYVAGECPAVG